MKDRIGNVVTFWVLIVLCSGAVLGQTPVTDRAAADTVHLLPRWKKGEKQRFEIVENAVTYFSKEKAMNCVIRGGSG